MADLFIDNYFFSSLKELSGSSVLTKEKQLVFVSTEMEVLFILVDPMELLKLGRHLLASS